MPAAHHRAVLSLLGIEQWVPRARLAEFQAPVSSGLSEGVSRPNGPGVVAAAESAASVRGVVPAAAPGPDYPRSEARAGPPASVTEPTPPRPADDRFSLASTCISVDVLMLADTDPPGLRGEEHALFARMASALAGGGVPDIADISWPPPQFRVPGAARAGEADRHLTTLLEVYRQRGLHTIVLVGSAQHARLQRLLGDAVSLVVVPSLTEMLADPAHKRAAWEAMRHLARPA